MKQVGNFATLWGSAYYDFTLDTTHPKVGISFEIY
jgi:hypothetical protein